MKEYLTGTTFIVSFQLVAINHDEEAAFTIMLHIYKTSLWQGERYTVAANCLMHKMYSKLNSVRYYMQALLNWEFLSRPHTMPTTQPFSRDRARQCVSHYSVGTCISDIITRISLELLSCRYLGIVRTYYWPKESSTRGTIYSIIP